MEWKSAATGLGLASLALAPCCGSDGSDPLAGASGSVATLAPERAPLNIPAEGWVPAEGEIRLGSGRAPTLDDPEVTVLRRN